MALILGIGGFFGYIYFSKNSTKKITENTNTEVEAPQIYEEKALTNEEKISQLKRRMNFKSVIRKGDFYSIKNMKDTALQYYLDAYAKLPNDHIIEKKIGDTYFEMKNFEKAYFYYTQIPGGEMDDKMKDKVFKTLLYTGNKNMRDEFNKVQASQEIKEYYDKILVCYTGIANCLQEIKSYSGTTEKINEIRKNMIDYSNVQNSDPNTKYAALAGDFFKNKDYLAAATISEEALSKRPDYSSVLKVAGFSWYELGNYKKSNEYLQRYYQLEPKDVTVTYILGIINFYLENYISSNLYFNAAVLNGYSPKTELQKRLAYNYYIIGDKKNMLKVFRYILDEKDTTQDDYSVALFTAIEEKEYSKAMLRANKGIKRFPESDMLYAFRGRIYMIRDEQINALNDLNLAVSMNPRNAVALFNLGVMSFEKKDYNVAKDYFKNTIIADKNGTFGDNSEKKLKEVEKAIKEEKANALSNSGGLNPIN
ncbi:MAG: hypothetical protein PHY51_03950 [Candidatus Gracilibacteria bacterium]|nr:hypothetical protein [Candidatus Gracilibacteria bacterium]